jgi:hypothetical protein
VRLHLSVGRPSLLKLGLKGVHAPDDAGVRAADERPIVALDHRNRRAHDAGELKDGHTGGEGVRGKRGAKVIDARRRVDARCLDRRPPRSLAEVVEVERVSGRRSRK